MLETMSYEDRENFYNRYFDLGMLNCSITDRLALIGLVCNVTHQLQLKKPDVNCYKVIMKIADNVNVQYFRQFLEGLSIICENVMRNANEFPDFGIKNGKERISKIKEILNSWLPF